MIYVKINGAEYRAEIDGLVSDSRWDGRESKTIKTDELDYAEASALFVDGAAWSIVDRSTVPVIDPETGDPTGATEEVVNEYDNSAFCVAGDITDHRDGTISVKMGKETDLELAYGLIYG